MKGSALQGWRRLLAIVGLAVLPAAQSRAEVPHYGYRIVRSFPHDAQAFTEGLFFHDGWMFESTGLEGRSTIRKVRLQTGEVVASRSLSPAYFGEGVVDWRGRLLELTWRSGVGFIYGLSDFLPIGEFRYPGEGWALTRDDHRLIMSDGTADLRFLNPETLTETGRLHVTDEGRPVGNLNELEYVRGEIFANVWETDLIARIDPRTGHVQGWIDLSGLKVQAGAGADHDAVLNGIAYDRAHDRLFVTGKLWPRLFEIRLVPELARELRVHRASGKTAASGRSAAW